jgi:hypothetical protein
MFPKGDIAPGGAPSDDFSADMAILNAEDTPPAGEPEGEPEVEESGEPEEGEPEEVEEVEEPEEVEPEAEEVEKPVEAKTGDKKVVPLHRRPTPKEITEKYPNFFKEFPDMRHAMFREQEYSSLFPTVDDAKEASSNAESFKHFSQLAMSGKVEDFKEFLSGVAEAKGLEPMAANFLPALYNTNRDMYFKVTTPIVASMLRYAYKQGTAQNNNDLKNAALHIANAVLGDMNFATGDKMPEAIIPEKKVDPELDKERKTFYQERYNTNRSEIQGTASQRLRNDIRKGLDPNGVFNEFTTNLLVNKVVEELGVKLGANERHMRAMNSMWKHAYEAGFAGNWKDRILSAYLSAARAEMPAIRAAIRAEALKERQAQAGRREQDATKSANRKDVPGSSNATGQRSGGRSPSAKEIDWSKTSDRDFLNDKITLRKN